MKTNPRPFVIAAVVFACLCIGLCAAAGVVGFFISAAGGINPATGSGPAPPASAPEAADQGEAGPGGTISPEIASQMDAIQVQVIQIRGLEPRESLTRTLYSAQDLRNRVVSDFLAEYSEQEARDDTRLLAVFGLLDEDFDLAGFITELYSEQIAGFYDDEKKEMVIVQGEGFSGPEKLTYAHEYMHALQDQHFDFDEGLRYDDQSCETEAERCAAVLALIEGEATLLEVEWLQGYASNQDRRELLDFYNDFESLTLDSAPPYIREDFIFPYDKGYLFAQALFDRGGWGALNAAFTNPPLTTEQILHPEKYPDEMPLEVSLPDLAAVLGSSWEVYDDNILGEWYTYLILAHGIAPQARISDAAAARAAAGWGGDRYQVLFSREAEQTAMALSTIWDTQEDAAEFAQAFETYADARYAVRSLDESRYLSWETPFETVIFFQQGLWSYWISAPDRPSAQALLNQVQNP